MVEPGRCPVCGAKPVIEVSNNRVRIRCMNYEEGTHEIEAKATSLAVALEMWGEKNESD